MGEAIVNSMLQAESSNTVLQTDMGGDADSAAWSSAGPFSQVYS